MLKRFKPYIQPLAQINTSIRDQFPFPLRFSVPAVLLLLGMLSGAALLQREASLSYQRTEEEAIQQARFSGLQTASTLEYLYRRSTSEAFSLEGANLVISQLGGDPNLKLALLANENNQISLATRYELRGQKLANIEVNHNVAVAEKVRQTLSGKVQLSSDRKSLQAVYPVLLKPAPGELRSSRVGLLLLEYDLSQQKRQAYADALQRSLEFSVGIVFLCAIAGLFFDKVLTQRAIRLAEASNSLAKGELDVRAGLRGSDELVHISTAFDRMADRIQSNTEALQASEKRFRSLVSNIAGIIYRCAYDADWTMEFISDAIAEISGYPASDFIQNQVRTFASIIHPDDGPIVEPMVALSVANQKPYTVEYRLIRADGSIRWVYEKGQAIFDDDGNVLCLDGAIFDITERKQAETELKQALHELQQAQAQLIQAEKMSGLGQLVAGVAHEINNPVNFISGNLTHANEYTQDLLHLVSLYQQYYPQPASEIQAELEAMDLDFLIEDFPKMLTSMKVGADRIQQIVLSLRNFSRLDEAEMKPVDIHEGIDSTLLILQNRLKAKPDHPGIQIIKEYGALPQVECYACQLNQVFMNVINNAIDALDSYNSQRSITDIRNKPATITIRTQVLSRDRVVVRIIDNGPGMPPKVKQRLFDPFFTTKPVGQGTGLGLSISYQIVADKHKGLLRCESQPGQGAEFWIEIPIQQSVKAPTPEATLV